MFEQLETIHPFLPPVVGLAGLIIVALLCDLLVKRLLLNFVKLFIRRSNFGWDDALLENNVFGRLAQVVPGLIIFIGIDFVPGLGESLPRLVKNVAMGYVVLMLTLTLSAALSAANQIYQRYPVARDRPLKGFFQLLQIVVWVLGAVMIIAAVLERSPLLLLSGFGAMTAILVLVFKDTILGLVASVQLTANDMVRVGDWIEMDRYGADGDVVDISLHTVKVQNWDKTITTIPTYHLIAESFTNWRAMSESGGRRIKRSIYIDQSSVRFLRAEEIDRFRRFSLLDAYIESKLEELERHRADLGDAGSEEVNRRRLTNIGTFRAYVFSYLKAHPWIHDDMTLMVRQLDPGPEGLPVEIYCFTRTTEWTAYEDIQSDIFDHIMAIVPEFDLRLFQKPAGSDIGRWLAPDAAAQSEIG